MLKTVYLPKTTFCGGIKNEIKKAAILSKSNFVKCSMCLNCVCKVSGGFSKTLVQVDIPMHALSEH